jgi:hypothetical protein
MLTIGTIGAACAWPREAYNPADLPAEYHPAVRAYFERYALRAMMPDARTARERDGMRERADEAASVAYLFWLENRTSRIPRGAHASALCGVRRLMERSGWQGRTGQRRAARRSITAERLAHRERLRGRHNPTPDAVAVACERMAQTPCHAGKAYRLAKALGLPGVRELVREACGFSPEG